ncbi:hypothetical protein ACFV4F_07645 [Kitasatospora sp. NPDC059722]|uniref:hypothetical protein n=1 Tax=Kitasatospora sp. NPDC059722 TaxID=3346925 RepID=UPI0036C1200E
MSDDKLADDPKKKPGGEDDGNTFKVTDSYLLDFAQTKLTTMLQDLRTHPTRVALQQFVLGIGGGQFSGDYASLLAGGGTVLPSVKQIESSFTKYCQSLENQFKSLEDQVQKMIDDLSRAERDLKNGADDALSAAQMMYLVQDILGGGGLKV